MLVDQNFPLALQTVSSTSRDQPVSFQGIKSAASLMVTEPNRQQHLVSGIFRKPDRTKAVDS